MIAVKRQSETCDYCGLPLPGACNTPSDEESQVAKYCCFGCRFAADVTQEKGEEGAVRWTLTRLGLSIFFTMGVMVFTMALWSYDVYDVDLEGQLVASLTDIYRYLCLLFSYPVLFFLGIPLLINAVEALKRGSLSTDLLLITGVIAAYLFSTISVFRGTGHVYFEVGCMVLVMVTLGRWLEATGKLRATATLDSLEKLLPATVRRWTENRDEEIPLEDVQTGDLLHVLPAERFPAEGKLHDRPASVDEQVFTGESWPVEKQAGDSVLAGTLNLDGDVIIEVTALPGEGSFWQLIEAVRNARHSQGHYQQLADRVSAGFFPAVALIAFGSLGYHWQQGDLETGLLRAMAVVLIACPCALGLATPMAIWAALGRAAREQVLFRHGRAVEQLSQVRGVLFDKTGTLTTGSPQVVRFVCSAGEDEQRVLQRTASLAAVSPHALTKAILDFTAKPTEPELFASTRTEPGRGVVAQTAAADEQVVLGNPQFLADYGLQLDHTLAVTIAEARESGYPLCLVGWGEKVRAAFFFHEQLREEAVPAIRQCKQAGYYVGVLTGDHEIRARQLADQLQVPIDAQLLPTEKVSRLKEISQRIGPMAMVGDGINDAPALAASHVGIALGCGTDVSRESADVCLLGDDLLHLPWILDLSRKTIWVVRQNLIWAFGYNTFGILLAVQGTLNPILAAVFMMVSSLLVVTNSLRISRFPGVGSSNAALASSASSATATMGDPAAADSTNAPLSAEVGTR